MISKVKLFVILGIVLVVVVVAVIVGVVVHKNSDDSDSDGDGTKIDDFVVQTECGPVKGITERVLAFSTVKNVTTYVYKGIPYAKPPVGDLRWAPPVRLSDDKRNCWKGTFIAKTFGNKCAQVVKGKTVGSEDCLYLNVHTPNLTGNLPVFVWIHGGGLMNGEGETYGYSPDSEFVASMNIVSVSINYRLSAFGFLTLKELRKNGTDGNYGIMDQILVLKWIQSNIKNFGGDPNSVTLCGESSGGTAIFALLASPLADGLFHKAIPMSGSPKFEKSYIDAENENRIFINNSKCRTFNTSDEIRTCLYGLNTEEVNQAVPGQVYPYWDGPDLFDFPTKGFLAGALVVVDGNVVPKPPKNLSQINFNSATNVSILMGYTAQEINVEPVKRFIGENASSEVKEFIKGRLDNFRSKFMNEVWDDLYKSQTENLTTDREAQHLYETMATDVRVSCPTNKLAKDFRKSKHHNVYQYVVTNAPATPIIAPPIYWFNAFHIWDTYALFGYKSIIFVMKHSVSGSDIEFMKSIRATVLKFMKEGSVDWKTTQTGIFNQDGGVTVINDDYQQRQCEFWNDAKNGFVPYAWIN
ncbi:carboxylesterase 1F-like [Hydractinia symbiolongicarpus]|uniref:carboxylesterase 1F-like n=1 Tax=Hydractinia symbiolongicarpus TaxID=13093 RepID=UPI00255005A7|nr:carboxylesterase 1F-like [Hydractinia symbiolongicarpus]XP_057302646.1 carboxylesterase 1F-like [Hydractinia symbiolongicarpus]